MIPFGGGTSVVGGVAPERGGRETAVSLDLGRLDAIARRRRALAPARASARGPAAARARPRARRPRPAPGARAAELRVGDGRRLRGDALGGPGLDGLRPLRRARGRRCGARRPPASWRRSTPRRAPPGPTCARSCSARRARSARSPSSCCACGRSRPSSATRRGCCARFDAGCEALRALAQAEVAPDVTRLSDARRDAHDARARRRRRRLVRRAGGVALRALGYRPGCLLVDGLGGRAGRRLAPPRARRADAAIRRRGSAGPRTGRWRGARRASPAPHLRDALLDRGVLVETLETATTWTGLAALHGAVRDALERALPATPPIVGCHVSHLYPDGASLYFTVLARQDPDDPARSVARGQARRRRRDRRGRGDDHAPPRGRPRPRGLARGRARRARHRAPARGQAALRPHGHHESRRSCCPASGPGAACR